MFVTFDVFQPVMEVPVNDWQLLNIVPIDVMFAVFQPDKLPLKLLSLKNIP